MNYTFSIHSLHRFEQRGFTKDVLNILLFFGDYKKVAGNAEQISLSKKTENELLYFLNKKIKCIERQ
jgi:hypothetical protein